MIFFASLVLIVFFVVVATETVMMWRHFNFPFLLFGFFDAVVVLGKVISILC